MASDKQIQANRANARRSTGPTSTEGKDCARFNALKHGLTARTVVLPGEDPAVLDARVADWKADLKPAGPFEDYLVERAAHFSWVLDRSDRTLAVRIADQVRKADDDRARWEADEIAALSAALFRDPHGPLALYPHPGKDALRISWPKELPDPLDPAAIVGRLESFAAGCRWLLDRWADLREILDDGRKWQGPDRFRCVRLLGKQPMDALDDDRVMAVYLACHAMDPAGRPAFADLRSEMWVEEFRAFERRAEGRGVKQRTPPDPAAGKAALLAIIGQATGRLEVLRACLLEKEAADRRTLGARMAFDDLPEGELFRRYQASNARTFFRSVDTLVKARKENDRDRGRGDEPGGPAGDGDPASPIADETNPIPPDTPAPENAASDLAPPAFAASVPSRAADRVDPDRLELEPRTADGPPRGEARPQEAAAATAPEPTAPGTAPPDAPRPPRPEPGGEDDRPGAPSPPDRPARRVGTAHRSEPPADAAAVLSDGAPAPEPADETNPIPIPAAEDAKQPAAEPVDETKPIPIPAAGPCEEEAIAARARRRPPSPDRPVPEPIKRTSTEVPHRDAAGECFDTRMTPDPIIEVPADAAPAAIGRESIPPDPGRTRPPPRSDPP